MALDNVRFNYDFGNLMSRHRGRLRPEEDWLAAQPYCAHLHVKDVRRTAEGWVHTSIGQGDINYREIFVLVQKLEPRVFISLEIPLRMMRHVDGTPYDPLPPPPIGVIEQTLVESMAFLTT
jgi:sugar phosphate isomerase/epimerase